MLKWVNRLRLSPWTPAPVQLGGNPQLPALPEKQRLQTTYLAPQLRLPPEGQVLKSSRSESQWGLSSSPTGQTKQWLLIGSVNIYQGYLPAGLSTERAGKNVHLHLPVCPWKGFAGILYKWLSQRSNFNQSASRCWLQSLQGPKGPVGTCPTFCLQILPTIKPRLPLLPGRSFSTHLTPQLLWLLP